MGSTWSSRFRLPLSPASTISGTLKPNDSEWAMVSDPDSVTTAAEVIEPRLDGAGISVGIVVARFNELFTTHLLRACRRELRPAWGA